MGLIKATVNAAQGTLRDQYKDIIFCDSMASNVLVKRGQKQVLAGGTNRGNDNIITDGSKVHIADGQFLLIVENGRVVDFSAEPGDYTYDTGTSPSMLTGGFKGLKESFKTLGGRIQAGGQPDHDQRVYFINLKEIMDNKVGAGDIPFRDSEFNFTMKIRCYGTYSYKITDPLMFYKNVVGNVATDFTRDKIDAQFKAEVQKSLQPALTRIGLKNIPYDQLGLFNKEISEEINNELTEEWVNRRGISVESFALSQVTPDAESAKKIEEFQSTRVYTDARMLGARIGTAQANAMETAAGNEAGAMTGFLGMGFAQQAGGLNATQLMEMGNQQQAQPPKPLVQPQAPEGWSCTNCATINTGKFCTECGTPEPLKEGDWDCPSCNTINKGKFCIECGTKKPEEASESCGECGYTAEKPFKFCPECGTVN